MDKKVTDSTQRGYYIVYLFSEDMCRLYLTLAQGVTETKRDEMERVKRDIRQQIPVGGRVQTDNAIRLSASKRAKEYERSVAAYIAYSFDNLPSDEQLVSDLKTMIGYYRQYVERTEKMTPFKQSLSDRSVVEHIHFYITAKGFYYTQEEVMNLFLSLKTKPFVILSGISGTGKTKIAQWLAESVGATEDNGQFILIPVRPDWNDGSDLLGYVDIKGDFKPGPLTNVITEAENHPDKPYFVVLDEMNLARVEHYFSDVLSVMESRRWENGRIISSRLLPKETAGRDLFLPPNVYIIGTVNMDETTHPFSKKVLDRANTIEFNRIRLDHLDFLRDLPTVAPLSGGQEWFAAR
ncbi:restriction endonuclease [Geobacillus thermodenitrificans]|nr:restriction endonuclease [Geobacillus thermodenitrificans]